MISKRELIELSVYCIFKKSYSLSLDPGFPLFYMLDYISTQACKQNVICIRWKNVKILHNTRKYVFKKKSVYWLYSTAELKYPDAVSPSCMFLTSPPFSTHIFITCSFVYRRSPATTSATTTRSPSKRKLVGIFLAVLKTTMESSTSSCTFYTDLIMAFDE